jgi:hypothetical protein
MNIVYNLENLGAVFLEIEVVPCIKMKHMIIYFPNLVVAEGAFGWAYFYQFELCLMTKKYT